MEWFQVFDKARCQHIDTFASDHSMFLLDTDPGKERRKKRFYFDKRWLQREGIQQVIEKAWSKEEQGSRMFKVTKKVKNCRIELLKWRNTFQANSRQKISELKKDFERVKESSLDNRKEILAHIKDQLKAAYKEGENFWCQKARINWLREGDKNTKYFHSYVKGKRVSNRIRTLQRGNGSWTTNEEEIVTEISDFFKDLFNSGRRGDMSEILDGIPQSITQEMNERLTQAVEEKEIHEALFSMNSKKAPGQDRMTPLFFQRFWSTIKCDVILAIKPSFPQDTCLNQ